MEIPAVTECVLAEAAQDGGEACLDGAQGEPVILHFEPEIIGPHGPVRLKIKYHRVQDIAFEEHGLSEHGSRHLRARVQIGHYELVTGPGIERTEGVPRKHGGCLAGERHDHAGYRQIITSSEIDD
jgi:hypothetical protein